MSQRRALTGLRPQSYEHPLDSKALDALQHTPGLEILVRKWNEWGIERALRIELVGSHLKVTKDSFPDLYELVDEARRVLDVPSNPEIYIMAEGGINAYTIGVEPPFVLLSSGAIDMLTQDELFFVIAHELGHIKSGHGLYYEMAQFLPVVGNAVGAATLGIGKLLTGAVQLALYNWRRTSELTADRAGLLACQDVNVAMSTMMKLAGLPGRYYGKVNPDDFITQARAFQAFDDDTMSSIVKWLKTAGRTHPWTVLRAQQCLAWVDSGEYERVLSRPSQVPLALPAGVKAFCTKCGNGLGDTAVFCPKCGVKRGTAA